ncbi:sugar phosphate nucleotidyltransferase [Streptomyces sp. ALI-76-A]|uniref:sugar phosphate nucleotidyltransferase n=1 Tax=Streptomyces sp. ALI-76-A TaxID=3025736 RepID=UPI003364F23A
MKALVLSGCAGTRLRPITHTSAGHLVPAANWAAVFHGAEPLAAAGVTDAGTAVRGSAAERAGLLGDGDDSKVQITS